MNMDRFKYHIIAYNPRRFRRGQEETFVSWGLCHKEAEACYQSLSEAYIYVKIIYGEMMDKAYFDKHPSLLEVEK